MNSFNTNIENPFISPSSTPGSGRNSLLNVSDNNISDIKEEIVNINSLNPSKNSNINNSNININVNPSLNQINSDNNINNDERNNSTKQFNINAIGDNNENMNVSTTSKKTVKTAITFNLDKKERVKKENSISENKTEKDDKVNSENDKEVSAYCPVCKAKASFMCSSCGPVIFYCSQSCQIAHWPEHRLVCKGVKHKSKVILEHKKTESIFGEIIDPTIGSNLVVGTRNVAQLINLKRSRTESNKSKIVSILSNRLSSNSLMNSIEEEDEEDENEEEEDEEEENGFDIETINSKTNLLTDDDGKISPLINIKTDSSYLNKGKANTDNDVKNTSIVKNKENKDNNTSLISSTDIKKKKNEKNKKAKKKHRNSVTTLLNKAAEDEEFIEDLKFYIQQIFLIIKPVLLCILLTILWVKLTDSSNEKVSIKQYVNNRKSVGFVENSEDNQSSTLGEVLKLLLKIILTTIIIVILFVFSCMKTLTGIFIAMVTLLLSFISLFLFYNIIGIHNIPVDTITIGIITWNIAVVGVIVIFWKGPLSVQQYYLVYISSIMAYSLSKIMTSYVTWLFLAALSIWDLIAVLTPFGPLRLLLKYSEENNQEIPALLYNLMITLMAAPPSSAIKSKNNKKNEEEKEKDNDHNKISELTNNRNISSDNEAQMLNDSSFSNEIFGILDMKTVHSPNSSSKPKHSNNDIIPSSPKHSNNNNNISSSPKPTAVNPSSPKQSNINPSSPKPKTINPSSPKQSNIIPSSPKQSGLLYSTTAQKHTSIPISISSASSGTLNKKRNPTLKKYPSNSSISLNGGRRLSRPHSGYRPYLSSQQGSISDENSSTANLFQDLNNNNGNNYSFGSLKRSNSKASSFTILSTDSQLGKKKIIDKKYLYSPGDTRKLTISRSPSEKRINRSLNRTSRNYTSSSLVDMDSSVVSDDTGYISPTNVSFSSVSPLISQRRKSQISSSNSYGHSSSHSHNNHEHHHHHHHSDRSTVSSPSSIHYHSSHHKHKSKSKNNKSYSGLGPSSDVFTHIEQLGLIKRGKRGKDKKKKKEKEKEKIEMQRKEDQEEEAESTGIKLGLGDFVFYSVLVARAAIDDKDWLVTINCTVAVITGLTITIFLLAVLKKALPALPISIAFGLIFYCISKFFITSFVNNGIIFIYRFAIDKDIYSIYKEIFNKYISFSSGLSIGKYYGGFSYF
jgi:hypothetical protein